MILTQKQLERMGLDDEPAQKKAPATTSKVRFGARRGFSADTEYADLEKPTAHAPKGPPTDQLLADAASRRKERRRLERESGR